tara:strand:+ start:617 stop:898 length:282 start_codon:yes stop_codon:yes gene_type:complete
MPSNGRIRSASVSTTDSIPFDLGLDGSKVVIYTNQDVRVAYDQNSLTDTGLYFIIPAGTIMIFDQPTPFDSLIWMRADTANATVRTWVMGATY